MLNLTVSLQIKHFSTCTAALTLISRNPTIQHPPDLWFSNYEEQDSFRTLKADTKFRLMSQFQNDFVSKNQTDYIVLSGLESITFACEADYPITWKFPFTEQLVHISAYEIASKEFRISEFGPETTDPVNTRFKSFITIDCVEHNFLGLNMTCSSKNLSPGFESSLYLYVSGQHNIENEGETLFVETVPAPRNKLSNMLSSLPPVKFPCRPASPNMKVKLEKETNVKISENSTQQKVWAQISPNLNDLSFDPKTGFTLQRGMLGNRIFGLYRCSALQVDDDAIDEELPKEQYLYINVTKATTSNMDSSEVEEHSMSRDFEPRSVIHKPASVKMEGTDLETHLSLPVTSIKCCSGLQNKPPHLLVQSCSDHVQCQLSWDEFLQYESVEDNLLEKIGDGEIVNGTTDCREQYFGISNILVMCRGETLDYADYFVSIFYPSAGGLVENRPIRIHQDNYDHGHLNWSNLTALTYHEKWKVAQNAPESQKMIIIVAQHSGLPKDYNLETEIWFTSGQREESLPEDAYENQVYHFDEEATRIRKISKGLVEYPRDVYYEGEPLTFICFGLNIFYAAGPHLRLNWDNGTKTVLDPQSHSRTSHILHLADKALMDTADKQSVVGLSQIAQQGMRSTECLMPVIGSTKWDRISKNLTILPSIAPKIIETEEETVYFYLGDRGNVLHCTVIVGQPTPRVWILREGKPMRLKWDSDAKNKSATGQRWHKGTKGTESFDKDKRTATLRIIFRIIEHRHQGLFQCIAKNVKGTAIRKIRVFVLEKPGIALPLSLGAVGVLCIVLLGLAIKHMRDRRTVLSLRASNIHISINF